MKIKIKGKQKLSRENDSWLPVPRPRWVRVLDSVVTTYNIVLIGVIIWIILTLFFT